jgi:hypothetical protein
MTASKAAQITALLQQLFPEELRPEEHQRLGIELVDLVARATKGHWDLSKAQLTTRGARKATFGTALQKLRAATGMTQSDVTAKTHWHVAKVSRIETGRTPISYVDLAYLANLYGVASKTDELWALAEQTGAAQGPRNGRRAS